MYQQGSYRVTTANSPAWKDSNNAMDSFMSTSVTNKPQVDLPEKPKHLQLNRYLNNGFLNKQEFNNSENMFSATSGS